MPPLRRRLRAAAFMPLALAAAGTAALAQNESANTIGPPQLRDFTLPGQRTTPPAATPPAPSPTPPPAAARPRALAPAAAPARERPAPAPRPAETATRRDAAPLPAPAAAAPAPRAAAPAPVETVPEPVAPPAPAAAPAEPQNQGLSWLWPMAGGALLLLMAAAFLLRRRRPGATLDRAPEAEREAPFVKPEPEPVAAPEPEPEAPAAPRPWLELDIVPERASATDTEAVVNYSLTVTNQGDAEARNIRIDPRLFNAGAEGDTAAFLQGPIHEQSGSPQVVLAPGGSLKLNGQVAMPRTEVREIEMAGRLIFVPVVAINVAYDWTGGGSGRTSRSWLVGREADSPSAKMGPFRLDLGPRIYRSVGRREAKLVRV
jgi:hypothetical protein